MISTNHHRAMKKFRSFYMSSNEKLNVEMSSDLNKGIPTIRVRVNDTIIVSHNYDYYRKIESDPQNLNDSYSISIDKSGNAGIAEIPNYYVNLNWYEENIDPQIINEAWHKYNDKLHLHEIAKYLIYRDSLIINENITLLDNATFHLKLDYILPSWDVCITLPMYTKLCEDIPGLEEKLENSEDLAGQVRGKLRSLNKDLINKREINLSKIDKQMSVAHNLNDEFELAYHIKKQGYDIEFGNTNKNEPDYMINGKKVELKSSFPDTELNSNFPNPDTNLNQYAVRLHPTFRINGLNAH